MVLHAFFVFKDDPDTNMMQEYLTGLLPEDFEIHRFTDSSRVVSEVQVIAEPCLVFIQFEKMLVNGTNFIDTMRGEIPYAYTFVVCNGEDAKAEVKQNFRLDDNDILCCQNTCSENCDATSTFVRKLSGRMSLIAEVQKSLVEIKSKVQTIEERANQWVKKRTVYS